MFPISRHTILRPAPNMRAVAVVRLCRACTACAHTVRFRSNPTLLLVTDGPRFPRSASLLHPLPLPQSVPRCSADVPYELSPILRRSRHDSWSASRSRSSRCRLTPSRHPQAKPVSPAYRSRSRRTLRMHHRAISMLLEALHPFASERRLHLPLPSRLAREVRR